MVYCSVLYCSENVHYLVGEEMDHILVTSRSVLPIQLCEAVGQDMFTGKEVVVGEADGVGVNIQLVATSSVQYAIDVATVKLPHNCLQNHRDATK